MKSPESQAQTDQTHLPPDSVQDLDKKMKQLENALSSLRKTWMRPQYVAEIMEKNPQYSLMMECFLFGFSLREKLTQINRKNE